MPVKIEGTGKHQLTSDCSAVVYDCFCYSAVVAVLLLLLFSMRIVPKCTENNTKRQEKKFKKNHKTSHGAYIVHNRLYM